MTTDWSKLNVTAFNHLADPAATKPEKTGYVPCTRCWGVGTVHTYGTCFRCHGNTYDPTQRTWRFPKSWTKEQKLEFLAKKQEQAEKRLAASHKRALATQGSIEEAN
jgi:RecJ-like exonuclease